MFLVFSVFASAKSLELTPTLQVRPRAEAHTGREGIAQEGEDLFISQRARLGLRGRLGNVSAYAVVQDVRVWGEETHTLFDASADRLDLHQAWLAIDFGESSGLRVGRQEIALHEHRLIGTVEWAQQARSFDAIRAHVGKSGLNGELAMAILGDPSAAVPPAPVATTPRPYQEMGIARAGWAAEDPATLIDALYVVVRANSDDGVDANDGAIHTAGLYAKGEMGILRARAEAYVQVGTMGDTPRRAWLAAVSATLAPDLSARPTFTLWVDHLSGDADLGDGTDTAFDTLFDTRHKFYGLMDVMNFSVGGRADGRGLQDIAMKFAITPVESVTAKLEAHLFLPSAAQGGNSVLGEEIDVILAYRWKPALAVQLFGASLFRSGLDPDLWAALQIDVEL